MAEARAKYRESLPQLGSGLFLTDSGLETWLIFTQGFALLEFAAFPLLDDARGRGHIVAYFRRHGRIAVGAGLGFILEAPTWRASAAWGRRLGYGAAALARVNREAIELMLALRAEFETGASPFVVSGQLGPAGDAYRPEALMTPARAERYHAPQVAALADAGADLVSALTLTHTGEAVGIVRAARAAGVPAVISFTLETDGRLPSGEGLAEAIALVDRATGGGPAYYMVNCAHPTHLEGALAGGSGGAGGDALSRLRGLRANASAKSHAELDEAGELDEGDAQQLAGQYRALRRRLPGLTILGGCCGTDHRHVAAIAGACAA